MNFVRAETLVQEITADGKVRDIITERVKTAKEKEADEKEERIRNLPEFKRARGDSEKSLSSQLAGNAEKAGMAEEDNAAEAKQYNVHTIDEEEYEHYENVERAGRDKKRQQVAEDKVAFATFASERERMRTDEPSDNLLASLERQKREAASRKRPAPAAQDRLRGRITVKAKVGADASSASEPAAAPKVEPSGSGVGGLGLGGYDSDSDE
mmetsp:Transcript_92423/g.298737  ORF Transcript_92423/g.298737 Transcript_92423/m.298737 type:complete len:211 (-) Transcript_92423:84-716(-)|eukprot:CAMPEP_0203869904 /NCGR_PEP_ID=MMETSP0359-20131031/17966_1 /ASSEMBLY_ACC=CAM_ASM_000338 /TAXON_ID=268821 /ORGANISM="Scrippsiella Hangoei, Strain SHTV-5" /LENGTH=210 /DNA_ID=CAMNT_0050788567 /DNA_START=134 /DNA_END=766 /DNA_ORIENTATION=+